MDYHSIHDDRIQTTTAYMMDSWITHIAALNREQHVQRRQNCARGIFYMVQNNAPRGTSERMDKTIVQLFLPLISKEMDNNVLETLIKIIHVLCLEPNNSHLVAEPTLNHEKLCAAPLLWNGMASIILPFLIDVTTTDRSPHT